MAVIKFGSIVTDGRGSLGGSTIQSDRSGHIWRNKPLPLKSRSQAQSLIRSYNKAMQAGWRALSESDKDIWNDYPKLNHIFNRSGEKHPLSGHSLWMKYQFFYAKRSAPFETNPSVASNPLLLMKPGRGTFDIGTESWVAEGNNTISNDAGALKVTFVDDPIGARVYLKSASDLNANLITGRKYKILVRAKINLGSAYLNLRTNVNNNIGTIKIYYSWFDFIFAATSPTLVNLRFNALNLNEIVWIDEWILQIT